MLIDHGKISEELLNKQSEFYTRPHARTALGIDSNRKIIIVLAEHYYIRDITAITMGEVQSIIKEKEKILAEKYNKQDPGEITLDLLHNHIN